MPRRTDGRTATSSGPRPAHGDDLALEFGDRTWTYRELDGAAEVLADRLVAAGVARRRPGRRCSPTARPSSSSPCSPIAQGRRAVRAAGPAPARQPRLGADRRRHRRRLVLVAARARPESPTHSAARGGHDTGSTAGRTVGRAGRAAASVAARTTPRTSCTRRARPAGRRASSSRTGRSIRLVTGTDYLQLGPDDRVGHLSNVAFDAATFEIWGPLLNGGTVVGVDADTASPAEPARTDSVAERSITVVFMTTALFNRIAAERPDAPSPPCDVRPLRRRGGRSEVRCGAILDAGPPERLLHVYGPTETTTFATWHEVERVAAGRRRRSRSGVPIANTTVYVLDRRMRPVPIGAVGELYVGGDGLATATSASRRTPPSASCPTRSAATGARLYRTGDRVRLAPAGIEFVGRATTRSRCAGSAIELGEIERVLRAIPRVAACRGRRPHRHRRRRRAGRLRRARPADADADVCASSWPASSLAPGLAPLHAARSARHPCRALPMNANGKIDRAALPDPVRRRWTTSRAMRRTARRRRSARLAEIWCDVLGVDSGRHPRRLLRARAATRCGRPSCSRGSSVDLRRRPRACARSSRQPTIAELAAGSTDGRAGTTPAACDRIAAVRPRRASAQLAQATDAEV